MFKILKKAQIAEKIIEYVVDTPLIAKKAEPGHFVLIRGDEHGERIPLTIADSDAEAGTLTLVMQEVGKGTIKLGKFEEGESFLDVVGPLGQGRPVSENGKNICCVAGGLGVAPIYPQAKAHHLAGNKVTSIIGSRTESLFIWRDMMEAVSDNVYYSTDDGSFGHHGFATQILDDLIKKGVKFDEVIAIGPVPHMRAVANCCKEHGVPVLVSLNPVMVDGTGMCGGCRVSIDDETKYVCVDGPEFDGAKVNFEELMARQSTYRHIEAEATRLHEARCEKDECKLEGQVARLTELRSSEDVAEHGLTGVFSEVASGYTAEEAVAEAKRCLVCKKPRCIDGCPVEIDIPGFIVGLQEGDFEKATEILKDKNNLPAICGRVCPQETQCEEICVVGIKSEPVKIGKLERFVADWEASQAKLKKIPVKTSAKEATGFKVAVIGSGPGGLTCAGDLAKLGHGATVFEAFHETGGVLRYGIPEFRLPKDIVDREVDYVRSLGVKFEMNMVIGKILTIDDLFEQGFDAVFVAVGAGAPRFLGIPGENLIGVYSANELLTRVNLMKAYLVGEYDTPVVMGDKVAVIGAGNVSMDAARVALRLGANEVSIVYRRSDVEIPARAEEVEHARQEGIKFKLLTNPVAILGDENDRVCGLECIQMELGEPDDSGRRRPVPIEGSNFVIECDMVIPALGTESNPILTKSAEGLELNKWGNIVVDPETCKSSLPGVYAGGDIVTGAATVIEAMGAGKIAAKSIHAYLNDLKPEAKTG